MSAEQSKFRQNNILDLFVECFSFKIEDASAIESFVQSFIVNNKFIVNCNQFIVTLQGEYCCYATLENRYEMTCATNPFCLKDFSNEENNSANIQNYE